MSLSFEKMEELHNDLEALITTYQSKCNLDKKIVISAIMKSLSIHILLIHTPDSVKDKIESDANDDTEARTISDIDINHMRYLSNFEKSEVTIKIRKLFTESDRLYRIEKYDEFMAKQMNILELLPSQAKLLNKYFKSSQKVNIHIRIPDLDLILKMHVAKCDAAGLDTIAKHIDDLNTSYSGFDYEYFQVIYKKYKNDYELYKRIYEFLQIHISGQQKELYKKLYIADARITKILMMADKIGIIKRKKFGNNWTLHWNSKTS